MSDDNRDVFEAEDETVVNGNDNEVFQTEEKNSWINELRSALERGCDLGVIRNIGKCRTLTDDLRLPVWKVVAFEIREDAICCVLSFRLV